MNGNVFFVVVVLVHIYVCNVIEFELECMGLLIILLLFFVGSIVFVPKMRFLASVVNLVVGIFDDLKGNFPFLHSYLCMYVCVMVEFELEFMRVVDKMLLFVVVGIFCATCEIFIHK